MLKSYYRVILDLLAACTCMGFAAIFRDTRRLLAVTADEVATLRGGNALAQFLDPETGINPPIWRMVVQSIKGAGDWIVDARQLSIAASVVAVGVLYALGRRVSGRWWGGLAAAVPFAVAPVCVIESSYARVYGFWSLTAALWMLTLSYWIHHRGRWSTGALALLTVCLSWLHYASLPWLLALAFIVQAMPAVRGLWRTMLPAAVFALPLLWRIGVSQGRGVPPERTPVELLLALLSLGSEAPQGSILDQPAYIMLIVLLLGLTSRVDRQNATRFWAWSMVVMVGSYVALNYVQLVRPAANVMVAVVLGPALAASLGAYRLGWIGLLVSIWSFGRVMPLSYPVTRPDDRRWAVIERVVEWANTGVLGDGDVMISPPEEAVVVMYGLTHRHISSVMALAGCPDATDCVALAKRRWLFGDDISASAARWRIDFSGHQAMPPGCRPARTQHDVVKIYDCRQD